MFARCLRKRVIIENEDTALLVYLKKRNEKQKSDVGKVLKIES